MQRVCQKCNTLVSGEGSFCPNCGEPLPAAVQLEKETVQTASVQFTNTVGGYQQSAPQPDRTAPQANAIPNYAGAGNNNTQFTSANVVNTTEMTLGQWVGTLILTTWFGLISLILCIVWGVSDSTPIAKKRYCQAMLIIQCISLAVSIITMIIVFTSMASLLPELVEAIEEASQSSTRIYY